MGKHELEHVPLRDSDTEKKTSSARLPSWGARSSPRSLKLAHEEEGLTGEQDTAMAGFTNMAGLIAAVSYWYIRGANVGMLDKELGTLAGGASERPATLDMSDVFVWGPTTHIEFWAAVLGGMLTLAHYFLLLKAFEGASSTVLLPLVQVASVATLIGSSVIAIFRHESWITLRHLSAYVLLFLGGVLPACEGQLQALLKPEFWRQSFVWCTILSELALGAHDLMLNACSYHGTAPGREVLLFACNKRLTAQLHALLLGTVPSKLLALSLVSETLTIVGYYLASIAYSLFYQAAVVHTAEASMSQLLNLMIAYALHHIFAIGRASAASGVRTKLVSFALVTIGLFLCGDEGGARRR
ncbi:hypothetical protein T492DRAFT_917982 [Pavlovales sp. CCMP2436]|nr:hypothetical protein T492DRAFT_917982 [Pavlovales sp. CCMP2436]